MTFNRVVIRDATVHTHNVHISVHPFKRSDGLCMMSHKGEYTNDWREPMPEWQQRLADMLWDEIPGLSTLFFGNGQITIQHAGVFDDKDIVAAATTILQPVLETQLILESI